MIVLSLSNRLRRRSSRRAPRLEGVTVMLCFKNRFEAIFPFHTSYALFGWTPGKQNYIGIVVIKCVKCLFCVKILC